MQCQCKRKCTHVDISGTEAVEFRRITQNNGHYAVKGHSRSPILAPIESDLCDLLVNETNLHLISRRFQVIADNWLNFRSQHGEQGITTFNTLVRGEPVNSGLRNLATRN